MAKTLNTNIYKPSEIQTQHCFLLKHKRSTDNDSTVTSQMKEKKKKKQNKEQWRLDKRLAQQTVRD